MKLSSSLLTVAKLVLLTMLVVSPFVVSLVRSQQAQAVEGRICYLTTIKYKAGNQPTVYKTKEECEGTDTNGVSCDGDSQYCAGTCFTGDASLGGLCSYGANNGSKGQCCQKLKVGSCLLNGVEIPNKSCVPGKAAACDNGTIIKKDSCFPSGSCLYNGTVITDKECVPGKAAACSSGEIVKKDSCLPDALKPVGSACSSGPECTTGTCSEGVCKIAGGGSCPSNRGADCVSGVCREGVCQSIGQCTRGSQCDSGVCSNGQCKVANGGSCLENDKCVSGVCDRDSGTCKAIASGGTCTQGSQCTSGLCYNGKCERTGCIQNSDCLSGVCDQDLEVCKPGTGTGGGNGGGNGSPLPSAGGGACSDNDYGKCDADCNCSSGEGECTSVHYCDELDENGWCVNLTPEVLQGTQSVNAQDLANATCKCVQVDILNGQNGSCVSGHINGDWSTHIGAAVACPDETASCSPPVPSAPPGGGGGGEESPPPGSSPSTPPVGPQCVSITMSNPNPIMGQQVTFTCGEVAGAARYVFRAVNPAGAPGILASTGRISAPLTVGAPGTYYAQCQICTGADDASCHAFEPVIPLLNN